jgi:hypothetical protein
MQKLVGRAGFLEKEVFITGAKYSRRPGVPAGIYAPVRNPVIKDPIMTFFTTEKREAEI